MVVIQYLSVDVVEGVCNIWTLSAALGLNGYVNTALGFGSFGPGGPGSQWMFTPSWTVPAFEPSQAADVVCPLTHLTLIQDRAGWPR